MRDTLLCSMESIKKNWVEVTEVRILTSHLGWILEAFAKESANAVGEQIRFKRLPTRRREYLNPSNWRVFNAPEFSSKKVLFLHHETLLRNEQKLLGIDARLLLTHFENENHINPELLLKLEDISRIVVQNEGMLNLLIRHGINSSKIRVGYGAVDRAVYYPQKVRTSREFVLVVGDCKPRKNPELISKVILENLNRRFVIHGLHWSKYLSNDALNSPNLKLINFSKTRNPLLMRQARLLLSLSMKEGGPIPVLEALASGTPVLATDTGFCKEVIPNAFGAVIPLNSNPREVSVVMNSLWEKKDECWSKDLLSQKFTWFELGKLLYGN